MIIIPKIHRNSSRPGRVMFQEYRDAAEALDKAIDPLLKTAPDARDHYVDPNDTAIEIARTQHRSRCERLQMVLDELRAIYNELAKSQGQPGW